MDTSAFSVGLSSSLLALELFNLRPIVSAETNITGFPLYEICQCVLIIHSFNKHLTTVCAIHQALLRVYVGHKDK